MLENFERQCDINPALLPSPKSMFSSRLPFEMHVAFYSFFCFSSSSVEGLFLFPDGSNTGLQQPVYEPAWSSWPCFYARQHEPGKHGSRNDAFQHEWATHGHEPASASWNESLQHPWAEDASASLHRPSAPVLAYTGHKETIPRRGNKIHYILCRLLFWLKVAACPLRQVCLFSSLSRNAAVKIWVTAALCFNVQSIQVGVCYVSQDDSHENQERPKTSQTLKTI